MKRILCFSLLLLCSPVFAQVTSNFDVDAEGWIFEDGATQFTPVYQSANGNPGPYLSITYSASTTTTEYWIAPAKFRGNHVLRSLGMNLILSLQQSQAGTKSNNNGDVRIIGSSFTLVYSFPV